MSSRGIEKLAWVLIYGGLLLASFGYFVWRGGAGAGLAGVVAGAVAVVAGIVLIGVRSRRGP